MNAVCCAYKPRHNANCVIVAIYILLNEVTLKNTITRHVIVIVLERVHAHGVIRREPVPAEPTIVV